MPRQIVGRLVGRFDLKTGATNLMSFVEKFFPLRLVSFMEIFDQMESSTN